MDRDELKPCRKCKSVNVGIDQFSPLRNRFVGECRDCDYMTATYDTAEEAIAAWNTRPHPSQWWALVVRARAFLTKAGKPQP